MILAKAVASAFALILLLSLLSFHPTDPTPLSDGQLSAPLHNLCGSVGAGLAGLLVAWMGVGAWLLPIYILWECWMPAVEDEDAKWLTRIAPRLAWMAFAFSVWT